MITQNNLCLCNKCREKLDPKFIEFKIENISCTSIYYYDDVLKGLIYQYKGCYDYELRDIFLEPFKKIIKLKYFDYCLVPVPSSKEDDELRGFNHVLEMAKTIGIKIYDVIYKTEKTKQSSKTFVERTKISKFLAIKNTELLKNKKILLFDDIYTTGSTIKACINLIKNLKPKKINCMVICKTKSVKHIDNSNTN